MFVFYLYLHKNLYICIINILSSIMVQQFLNNIIKDKSKSNAKADVLGQLAQQGGLTISELCQCLGYSIPFITKSLNELINAGLVQETGKKETYAKRAPRVYDLIPKSGYFLGIDQGKDCLSLGVCDFCGNMVHKKKVPFFYDDSEECFEELVNIITRYIDECGIEKSLILKACMSIGGRVNPVEGKAYSCFTCQKEPLANVLSERTGLSTCIDNDSRCMTYGEFLKGCCKGVKNAIFVNISWGLGIGIIFDGKLYFGNSGYSGEFGHMHIYNNGIICHCGKTGCLETEVSGMALQRKMTELLLSGETSILSDKVVNKKEPLTLQDILDAIAKEDVLSIEALQKMASELGTNLAGIINIFNPEMLIIGGDLSVTGDYLIQPINMGIKKFSLNVVNEDSKIVISELKDQAGLIGACLMARYKLLSE